MNDSFWFWSIAAVSLLGCIVAPFLFAVVFGPWWGLGAGVIGYAALLIEVGLYQRRQP